MAASAQTQFVEVYVDSLDAYGPGGSAVPGYQGTDYPQITFLRKILNIQSIAVLSASIPYSWYTINAGSNTFTFGWTETVSSILYTFTFTIVHPLGNYSSVVFASNMNTIFNALVAALPSNFNQFASLTSYNLPSTGVTSVAVTGGTGTYLLNITAGSTSAGGPNTFTALSMAFNVQTLVFSVSVTGQSANAQNITFNVSPNGGLAQVLGWGNPNLTGSNTPYASANIKGAAESYSATQTTSLQGANYLYLRSTLGQSGVEGVYLSNGSTSTNILCRIPIDQDFGNVISYINYCPQFLPLSKGVSSVESFYLTLGESLAPLVLNGANFAVRIGMMISDPQVVVSGQTNVGDKTTRTTPFPVPAPSVTYPPAGNPRKRMR